MTDGDYTDLEKGAKVRYRTHAAEVDEYTGEVVAVHSTDNGRMYDVKVDEKHLDPRQTEITEFIHADQILEVTSSGE